MNDLDNRTVAWIFLAIALASEAAPATRRVIGEVADGINHAVPTDKELNGSIRLLQSLRFVQSSGKSLSLTPSGAAFVASARERESTMFGVWSSLTAALSEVPRVGR